MADEPELCDVTKTETTVRQFDSRGQLISETVTVVLSKTKPPNTERTGLYL